MLPVYGNLSLLPTNEILEKKVQTGKRIILKLFQIIVLETRKFLIVRAVITKDSHPS